MPSLCFMMDSLLGLNEEMNTRRQELLRIADEILAIEEVSLEPNSERIKKTVTRIGWREQWSLAKEIIRKAKSKDGLTDEDIILLDQLFKPELEEPRLRVLKYHPSILPEKQSLISDLYDFGVFILNRGSIEDYYPPEVSGTDKPSKAQDYCRKVTCKDHVYQSCVIYSENENGDKYSEFDAIFAKIFDGIVVD